MDTILKLGNFTFMGLEIPSKISGVGGDHKLAIMELVGGTRVVDAMGAFSEPLTWSGLFLGNNAANRARELDTMRVKGKAVTLTWSNYNYSVVVQRFVCDFSKQYEIPYSIVCAVVADNTRPFVIPAPTIHEIIKVNIKSAGEYADALVETATVPAPEIKEKVSAISASITNIRNMAKATQSQIKEVRNKIQDAQRTVTQTIASVHNTLADITTLGGVLPNNPLSVNAARLTGKVQSVNNAVQLMNLKYTLTHVDKNCKMVGK